MVGGPKAEPNNHIMRKSIVLVAAVMLATSTAHAQTTGFGSGQMSMSSTSSPDTDAKTLQGTFGPAVGYNVSDRIVVGLGLNYTGSTITNKWENGGSISELERKSNLMTITPFARYMKKVDEDFSVYGQLAVGIGFGKNADETTTTGNGATTTVKEESDVNVIRMAVGPGVAYTFAPRWAITTEWGALSYESRSAKPDGEGSEKITENSFGLALNASAITFALNWLF